MKELSILIPAYNEEKTLQRNIDRLIDTIKHRDYQIIISNDGSTDDTPAVIASLCKENERISYVNASKNRGRGNALKRTIPHIQSPRVIFMDAGSKVSEGTPQEVRNDPKVIEAYID